MSLPPGPATSSLRQAASFGADPIGYLEQCRREFGDCFTLRLPGDPPRVVCGHPDDVRTMFALPPDAYTAGNLSIPLNLGARSLLFLDGDAHLADRRLMVPALHGERISSHVATMQTIAADTMAGWPIDEPLHFLEQMQRITLGAILQCVFGLEHGPRIDRLAELTTRWLNGMLNPSMFMLAMLLNAVRVRRFFDEQVRASRASYLADREGLRIWPWQRIADDKAELMAILRQEIADCRCEDSSERNDVLASLIAARHEDGSAMTDDALVDELLTLLVGGHETTANSLCWLFAELLTRPEILARVQDELHCVCPNGRLDPSAVKRLVYLEACIKESMRRSPIAPAVSRELLRPLELRRCVAPAGVIVWASIYLAHVNPEVWPDPHEFRPERFLDAGKTPPNHFLPFGGGRRRCIGMAFANLEMVVVAAEILLRAELRMHTSTRPRGVFKGITIAPADGLQVVCHGLKLA